MESTIHTDRNGNRYHKLGTYKILDIDAYDLLVAIMGSEDAVNVKMKGMAKDRQGYSVVIGNERR